MHAKLHEMAVDRSIERLTTMKSERAPHDAMWRQLREYFLPSRSFELRFGTPSLNKRRLVDTIGITASQRLTGLLQGLMMNPYMPFILPTLDGFEEPSPEEGAVLDRIGRAMHDALIDPQVHFPSASLETGLDEVVFGNSVMWGGRNIPGGMESWQAQRLHEHYWQENADGVVDTDYREFKLKLGAAARIFPAAERLQEKAAKKGANPDELVAFLHVTEPNDSGGETHGMATNKRYVSAVYCIDTREQCRIGGYERFPFAITRYTKQSGDPYGTGPAIDALPLVRLLNEILQTTGRAAELAADPPLVNLAGQQKEFDRRPGAVNNLDVAFMRRAQGGGDLIRRLYEPGNIVPSLEIARDLRSQVNLIFHIDWLNLGDHINMTATEVIDRRNIRMATMTPIVSRLESEKLTPVAERQFELMAPRLFRTIEVPDTMRGKNLRMRFNSPLSRAQRMADVEMFSKEIEILLAASQLDPAIIESVDLAAETRDALKAIGVDHRNLRTRREMQQRVAARQQSEQQAAAIEQAQGAAAAARDMGQALSTTEQAA